MTIAITDVVLRDAHQSLFATRLRLDDMLPIAAQLDDVGYGSLECWGGATFDACIRFLGEDPWLRLRELKKAMPKTPLQMLLRGQNLLGYRHYADDVVERTRRTNSTRCWRKSPACARTSALSRWSPPPRRLSALRRCSTC